MRKVTFLTGNLVVEDGKVYVQRQNGELVELSNRDVIKVDNGGRTMRVMYETILRNDQASEQCIYAGLYAMIEKVE